MVCVAICSATQTLACLHMPASLLVTLVFSACKSLCRFVTREPSYCTSYFCIAPHGAGLSRVLLHDVTPETSYRAMICYAALLCPLLCYGTPDSVLLAPGSATLLHAVLCHSMIRCVVLSVVVLRVVSPRCVATCCPIQYYATL
jgi:hypothetical protein